jgi:hypothetical protein
MKQQRHLLTNRSDEDDMILTVKQTYRELLKIQKQTKKFQQEFLMQIADKCSYEWNLSKASALNIIIQAEASKCTFARHGATMKGGEKGSIKSLMVPVPEYRSTLAETKEVEWMEIEDKQTIYRFLLKKMHSNLCIPQRVPLLVVR